MKKIATLFSLFFINAASAQQINNSNINIIGSYQNILITQVVSVIQSILPL